jgi:hypothetical protein
MIGQEDQKVTIAKFQGLYSRGSVDEVPMDHAQDLLNVYSMSDGRVQTRNGLVKTLNLNTNVRQFFGAAAVAPNLNEPVFGDPNETDGAGFLTQDQNSNIYIGNDPTPIITQGGMDSFAALNMADRTYLCPVGEGGAAIPGAHTKVINMLNGTARDAAGPAPFQSSGFMTGTENTGDAGNITAGVHQFAVIFQTDTGYWTQPGPKYRQAISVVASTSPNQPTICTLSNHGMVTGESHQITNSTYPALNDAWHITAIDANTFSLPINTFGVSSFGSPNIDAAVQYANVTCVGGHTVTLTNIPTGPPGTVARVIIGTLAGVLVNGVMQNTGFFFIPNYPGISQSEILDNTTTTTTLNFFDTDLQASADYLFDLLEFIPAGTGMCKYRGRMVIAGPWFPGTTERVILSNVDDPETFDYVSGYVQVQTESDGNSVATAFVLRDVLYMSKLVGIFATIDNGSSPSTWAVSVVDDVLGFYPLGSTAFTATQQTSADTGDIIAFANPAGFYIFDGVCRRPELSWKIQSFWERINFEFFVRVQCAHDPWNKRFYVIAPLDNNEDPNCFLMCDYSNGRDKDNVRWYVWQFPFNVSCLGMIYYLSSVSPGSYLYTLKVGSIDSGETGLWSLDPSATDDAGTLISSYYVPGPITFGLGGLNFFKLLNFRAWGTGSLNLTLAQEDGQNTVNPPSLTLSSTPGRELQRQINFTDEKLTLKFANGNNVGDMMSVDRVDIWGLMRWPLRPSV